MTDKRSVERRFLRVTDDAAPARGSLALEEPLEIRIGDVPIAVVMRTPGDDADLVRGFVLTEGILLDPDELAAVEAVDEGRVEAVLAPGVSVDAERFRRSMYATSSCGVCGKASIDAVRVTSGPLPDGPPVPAAVVGELPSRMHRHQATFHATGGLHAAGLFAPDGTTLAVREDVGRHNAVDKVVGATAPQRWRLHGTLLLVSGRISFEVVQKAAVAGIGLVAGISAPTSLAVDLAEELDITLVGFLREDGFNVYAGRIGLP